MLCEKCASEIEAVLCGNCESTVIRLGKYCYACGSKLQKKSDSEDEIDFSSRILCSDETCIGVINEKGICKVCGKPYSPESS